GGGGDRPHGEVQEEPAARARPRARPAGRGAGAAVIKIDDYRAVAPPGTVDIILKLAERVQGRRFVHVSGGRFGGGAAEMLRTMVPILADLGLDAGWEITGGDPGFYATGRALQQALEGTGRGLTDQAP